MPVAVSGAQVPAAVSGAQVHRCLWLCRARGAQVPVAVSGTLFGSSDEGITREVLRPLLLHELLSNPHHGIPAVAQ